MALLCRLHLWASLHVIFFVSTVHCLNGYSFGIYTFVLWCCVQAPAVFDLVLLFPLLASIVYRFHVFGYDPYSGYDQVVNVTDIGGFLFIKGHVTRRSANYPGDKCA